MTPDPRDAHDFTRVLLVPGHWSGSVEHFFHFLLGYLCPALLAIEDLGLDRVTMRQCGPLDSWLDLLRSRCDVEIIPPRVLAQRARDDRRPRVMLPAMDDPGSFDGDAIGRFAALMRTAIGVGGSGPSEPRTIVLDRVAPDPFYSLPDAEIPTAGAERRSLPNAADVAAAIPRAVRMSPELMDPVAQVRAFDAACAVVGQHGAGLAHMIWLPAGRAVVELMPPMPPRQRTIFASLARALGLRYSCINQTSHHEPVATGAVVDAWARVVSV